MREDYRIASIREMIYNVAVQAKDRRPLKEFLLQFGEPDEKPQKTPNQMEMIARMIAMAYNAPGKEM